MKRATHETGSPNPLEIYFRDINQTPLLSPEEERLLADRIAVGDIEARNQMVRANLRLVVRIARKYLGRGLSLSDLIEEGNLGLMRAAERYDVSKNTRFSTYATFWIRQSITRALSSSSRTVRIPAYMVTLVSRWRQMEAKLRDHLGRQPTELEVATALKTSPKRIEHIRRALAAWNSEGSSAHDVDGVFLDEKIEDDRFQAPDAEMIHSDRIRRLQTLLDEMEERELRILKMRFGFGMGKPQTLKQIGDELGLSRERVRQLADQALNHLSHAMLAD